MADDVRRPGAVTASAIVAIVGSVLTAGWGVMLMLATAMINRQEVREAMAEQQTPFSPVAMMTVMSVVAVAFATWGCASAVAVMRLKRWGRTSFLVFGGILAGFGTMNVIGAGIGAAVMSALPLPDPNVSRGLLVGMMGVMALVSLAAAGVGAWWLILFNRAAVKAQFVGLADVRRDIVAIPMRVFVIAWLMVAGVLALPILGLGLRMPFFFFGFEIRGWLASMLFVAQIAIGAVAGVGLLRRRFAAHTLAVGVYVFGLINFAAMAVMPGGFRRVMTAYQASAGGPPPLPAEFINSFMSLLLGAGLAFNVVLIVLLVTARPAYLRACAAPAPLPGS